MNFKFLQTSDWHLGMKLASLPDSIADSLRKSAIQSLNNVIQNAIADGINAVLLPGDIFDNPKPSYLVKAKIADILRQIPDHIPVYILPGTHDSYIDGGLWDDPLFVNYHIFKEDGFSSFDHPDLPVKIWGVPVSRSARDVNWLNRAPELEKGKINILLFHGDYRGDSREYEEWDYPFDYENVVNTKFDYIALGHHHSHKIIESDGKVLAAYSGSPFGWSFRKSEIGERFYITGNISNEQIDINPMLLEGHLIQRYKVDLNKPSDAKLIIEELESLRKSDFARVTVTGSNDNQNLKQELLNISYKLSNIVLIDDTTDKNVISESDNMHLDNLVKKLGDLEKNGEIDKQFHDRLVVRARILFSK